MPVAGSEGNRIITLRTVGEFKKVYRTGRRAANEEMVVYAIKNGLNYYRFGFSISRKVGGAVTRNKIRRRLKEILRRTVLQADGSSGGGKRADIIIVARPSAAAAGYAELSAGVSCLLDRLLGNGALKRRTAKPVSEMDRE